MPHIPAPLNRVGRSPIYPWATMRKGEYFFVPERAKNTMTTLAWSTGVKLGRKFTTRLCYMIGDGKQGWDPCEPDKRGAVLGIGVWRVA